jgi:hypothetical protein
MAELVKAEATSLGVFLDDYQGYVVEFHLKDGTIQTGYVGQYDDDYDPKADVLYNQGFDLIDHHPAPAPGDFSYTHLNWDDIQSFRRLDGEDNGTRND